VKLSLLDGEAGFQMQGVSASDHAGFCVRGAGDVNGDGVSDLVLSGYFGLGDGAFGEAYVVFGRSEGYPASMELHMLDGRRDGFTVFGALGEGVIASVAGGDFNGDSVSEVLIGAPFAGGEGGDGSGAAYVVYGKESALLATSVTLGRRHSCAWLLNDLSVKCWGVNGEGQLGIVGSFVHGDEEWEMGRALSAVDTGGDGRVLSVSAGSLFTCAVLSEGRVKCWGRNVEGQLGFVSGLPSVGVQAGEMGDKLPSVDLGVGVSVSRVSAGFGHVCAVTSDVRVKCWGDNSYGQLGVGDVLSRGGEREGMGDALPFVDLGGGGVGEVSVSCGRYHSCAVLEDQCVKCWGYNEFGGLGLGGLCGG